MVRDCLKRVDFSIVEGSDEQEQVTKNLGSIPGGVEDKTSHQLMFVDIIMVGIELNVLVHISASICLCLKRLLVNLVSRSKINWVGSRR